MNEMVIRRRYCLSATESLGRLTVSYVFVIIGQKVTYCGEKEQRNSADVAALVTGASYAALPVGR